ncbi:hypothetical protein MAIT1_03831 [Magnetofaba australis IT-1]|uniref:Uncharacterized protein n=1 Tax=Magnetofaba australis IT-1 TaxID=1434232 RepID=A0A1Y2K9R0_9PROT|nr:hypothetical protein MAIT1_03831 [Magnetofaba australis IT-1]
MTDGPRASGVHGGVGAAQKRRGAGNGVSGPVGIQILRPVEGLHIDPFGAVPGQGFGVAALEGLTSGVLPLRAVAARRVGHGQIPCGSQQK